MALSKYPNTEASHAEAIPRFSCGGCGGIHSWDCPYFGHPGNHINMSPEEIAAAEAKINQDRAAKKWPFKHLKEE